MCQTVYFIEGDGIGPEVWQVTREVVDAAMYKTYGTEKKINWVELLAGEKALKETGSLLPEDTLEALKDARYAIKGPLGTPISTGFRSLNVALRQSLDLYACIRPVRYYDGVSSPLKHPERVNMVIFRENTEDLYLGIEYKSASTEAKKLISFLRDYMEVELHPRTAIGIKPMTEYGSKRLVKKAIEYALEQSLPNVTIMHKGNIMKYTEGAFRDWGYEVADQYFAERCCRESDNQPTKLMIKDRIADAMFQEVLLYPQNYRVIAAPNLNGDYISDAIAAQVGGLGMAPGVNKSDTLSFYEATHGTAPTIAGQDKANPCSMVLSGAMMLKEIGLVEAAITIHNAVKSAIANKTVTVDLARQMVDAKEVSCKQFGDILLSFL